MMRHGEMEISFQFELVDIVMYGNVSGPYYELYLN